MDTALMSSVTALTLPKYTFTLNRFEIYKTMAAHTDTDWVYFTLKVGNQVFGPRHERIRDSNGNDLNDGSYNLDWSFGPLAIGPETPWVFTYQIINHGHDNDSTQDDVKIANTIATVLGTIGGIIAPEAIPVIKVIEKILDKLGLVISWIATGVNCDGVVLSDAVSGTGSFHNTHVASIDHYSETRRYIGPETPTFCGHNAQYTVTWTISVS